MKGPQTQFAVLRDDGSYGRIFRSRMVAELEGRHRVVPVTIQPGKGYWSWWDYEHTRFSMTFPSLIQFDTCFPCGYKGWEKNGDGEGVEVSVTPFQFIEEEAG